MGSSCDAWLPVYSKVINSRVIRLSLIQIPLGAITDFIQLGNLRDNENLRLRGLLMIQRRHLFIISSPSFSDCQSRLSIKYTATPPKND